MVVEMKAMEKEREKNGKFNHSDRSTANGFSQMHMGIAVEKLVLHLKWWTIRSWLAETHKYTIY